MNKIKMGPSPAVSRYHQQTRFFMNNDTSNFNDHDFPNPGYLLVCLGYQRLISKSKVDVDEEYWAHELNDLTEEAGVEGIQFNPETENNMLVTTKDKLGREHYERNLTMQWS